MSSFPADRSAVTRRLVASSAAAVIALVIVLLRTGGILDGPWALVLFTVMLLLIPTARPLSRRILMTGTIALGWSTVLWWHPIGGDTVGRLTIVWALLAAGLAYWLLAGQNAGDRVRTLVPTVRPVDAVPLATLAMGVFVWWGYLRPGTASSAYGNLNRAWDFMSHYSMTHMVRVHGATINHLGAAPGGETWASREYPQGFHSAAASVMEVLHVPAVGSVNQELIAFSQAVGIMAIASSVLAVAAVSSLPAVRRGGPLAWALPTFAVSIFVLGPGSAMIAMGYPNLHMALGLTAATLVIAVIAVRPGRPLMLLALLGGVVGVATNWFLLLVVTLPALLVVGYRARRPLLEFTSRWRTAGVVAVVVAAALTLGTTALQVLGVPTDYLLQAVGGNPPVTMPNALWTMALSVVLGLTLWVSLPTVARASDRRAAALMVVPVAGFLACVGYGLVQIATRDQLSYFFWKLLFGVWVTSMVVVLIVLATIIRRTRLLNGRPAITLLVSVIAVLTALQAFGLTAPDRTVSTGIGPRAPALDHRVTPAETPTSARIRAAAEWMDTQTTSADPILIALKTPDSHPLLSTMWFLALTGRWTTERQELFPLIDTLEGGDPAAIPAVADAVLARPERVILASPADRRTICAQLANPALCSRVVTWGPG